MMSMVPLLLLVLLLISCTIPIRNVEAAWYSEVCYTGPKYKVRVDEVTGKLVPVTITTTSNSAGEGEGDSSRSSGAVGGRVDPFYDTNNVLPETLITINRNDDYNADYNTDGDDILDDDDHATNDGQNRNRGLIDSISSMPLLLRSKRIWRDFDTVDTDEEFNDALIVVNENHQQQENLMKEVVEADHAIAAGFLKRYLQQSKQQQNEKEKKSLRVLQGGGGYIPSSSVDEFLELQEGEFFVRPCICPSSRWTFPDSYTTNSTDNTNTNDSGQGYTTEGVRTTINNTNTNNYGQYSYSNNDYYYIRNNQEESNLYLCQVSAMYCGILTNDYNMDGVHTGDGGVTNDNFQNSNTHTPIVKCYEQNSMRHIVVHNVWPLVMLCYFGLLILICCTDQGRTGIDYLKDRCSILLIKKPISYFLGGDGNVEFEYNDFNNRMLDRMLDEDDANDTTITTNNNRGGMTTMISTPNNDNGNNDNLSSPPHPQQQIIVIRPWFTCARCYMTNQRRHFEDSLLQQIQRLWRHQEYRNEFQRREQGLPTLQLKLKVKRFRMDQTTSGSHSIGFGSSTTTTTTTPTTPTVVVGSDDDDDDNDSKNSNSFTTTIDNSTDFDTDIDIDSPLAEDFDEETHGDDDGNEFVTLDLGANAEEEDGDDCNNPHDNDNDHDQHSIEEPTCTICFSPFEEGDKIGDLSCQHEFHVDCLKGWAQRKNACPLCNVRLGSPERPSTTHDHNRHNTNNNSNTNETMDTTSPTTTDTGTPPSPSIGMGRRFIQRLRYFFVDNNNNTNTAVADYTNAVNHRIDRSEIQMVNRVGIIASI